ncbi:MAG: ABC transporter permease [Lachnospiraceae bacterium]|nr:ABC transporter permease [Lachnospiraceae bacterium]MCI9149884.1 ABC transporter permease [Lachnospiraceae bacterium]
MGRYIGKRIGQAVLVLLLVSIFTYLLTYMMPGDPVYAMLGGDITQEQYDIAYEKMGLEDPIPMRYARWLFGFVTGDWGDSYKYSQPVLELMGERLPVTMYLGLWSIIISTLAGILLGVLCGTHRGKTIDSVLITCANFGSVMPAFWLAVLGMYIFSLKLGILPSHGFVLPTEGVADSLKMSVLPLIALSVGGIGGTTRQMRSGMLDVIRQDYIRTARSKGLKESKVVWRHAFRNAVLPVVTMTGMSFRNIVAGAVSIEQIFSIAGMGSLLINSILSKDVAVVQACIMMIAIVVVLSNLAVDVCYGVIDPRIRVE